MNSTAQILNAALAQRPHVVSLHSPSGEACLVFSSPCLQQRARVIAGWTEYFRAGYVAIIWMNGEPLGTCTTP